MVVVISVRGRGVLAPSRTVSSFGALDTPLIYSRRPLMAFGIDPGWRGWWCGWQNLQPVYRIGYLRLYGQTGVLVSETLLAVFGA